MKESNDGLRLIEKSKKGFFHLIFSRMGLIIVLLALQVLFLFSIFRWLENFVPHILGGTLLFTLGMVIYLLNTSMDPSAKITWLVVIALLPVFGSLFFLFTISDIGHSTLKKHYAQVAKDTKNMLTQDESVRMELKKEAPLADAMANYVASTGCFPVYQNCAVKYFPLGEDKYEELLVQLERAEKFIFLEYFIIKEGIMWGNVLDILARKVKEGVEVRLMYDGTDEFTNLPHDYPRRLEKLGIRCKVFAPLVPVISTHYNYRDHRKILVIDNRVAFTGGVNLADEYINRQVRFGHWKDTAVMVEGPAVSSFTLMFLQMWNMDKEEYDLDSYLKPSLPLSAPGFVMPYGDCPVDGDKVGETVYMSMLERAERYVHIMTPYLILDGELETSLRYCARRGVDVKLILPGIPDKKAAYALAKMHYASLLKEGVKIYEYTPGFVHAKVFSVDDKEAVVGTINLDYRSLYHHFECALWMRDVSCLADIEKDFQETLEKCRVVNKKNIWDGYKSLKPWGYLLKVVAPLL